MPNNRKGFFQPKNMIVDNGDNPTTRIVDIVPTIYNNSETISYAVYSNLPEGRFYYKIEGAQNSDFTDGSRSGFVNISSTGFGSFSKTLDITSNYASGNVEIYLTITTDIGDVLAAGGNVQIRQAVPFTATGGATTTIIDGYQIQQYAAVTHSGTPVDQGFVVSTLGERPDVDVVNVLWVGSGGAGGHGESLELRTSYPAGPITDYNYQGGGGGGGGAVRLANLTANTFSVGNSIVTVGNQGASTTFLGFSAYGGGTGAQGNIDTTANSAPSDGGSGGGGGPYASGQPAPSIAHPYSLGSDGGWGWTQPHFGSQKYTNSGGGGGASTVGGNATVVVGQVGGIGGSGGEGVTYNITGSNVVYGAGGGGGGVTSATAQPNAGKGGSGVTQATRVDATSGTDLTGAGGGGGKPYYGQGVTLGETLGGYGGRGTLIAKYLYQYRLFDTL